MRQVRARCAPDLTDGEVEKPLIPARGDGGRGGESTGGGDHLIARGEGGGRLAIALVLESGGFFRVCKA